MKNALISPAEHISYVSGWTSSTPPTPIITTIPNSARIAEVAANVFPVADPLFWVECGDEVNADSWYFDTESLQAVQIPPSPPDPQAIVEGAQTF
jgi:hypothetical protein